MIPTILLLVLFVAITALVARERLWGGMLRFLNVLVAATMATAWYEPLAALGDRFVNVADGGGNQGGLIPPFGQYFDAAAAWGLFVVILLVLRLATWFVARTRLPFPPMLDWAGGGVMALLTAWVVVGFTAMTFHMAPLSREAVQPTPDAKIFLGLAPDRKWLAWVRGSSMNGPFAAGGGRVFDKDADFVLRYGDRRAGNAAALKADSAE